MDINEAISKIGAIKIQRSIKKIDLTHEIENFILLAEALLEINSKKKFDYASVKKQIEFLIKWTWNIEQDGVDTKRGFLFKGKTEKGKTFLLKVWSEYLKLNHIPYKQNNDELPLICDVVNVKRIDGEYKDSNNGGYKVILKYSTMNCLALDDIGLEAEESKQYGNGVNVIEEIINLREEKNLLTFGTTNINSMKEQYDDRTTSRMKKLFYPIVFNHNNNYRDN